MTRKQIRGAAGAMAVAVAIIAAGACFDESRIDPISPENTGPVDLHLAVSALSAAEGQSIAVAIQGPPEASIVAVQGYIRFDATRLRYTGQMPARNAIVMVNDEDAGNGLLRLAAFSASAIGEQIAAFGFEVLSGGYTTSLRFEPEIVADPRLVELDARVASDVLLDTRLSGEKETVRWDHVDWALYMDPNVRAELEGHADGAMIVGLPPEGTIYGDVNFTGGTVATPCFGNPACPINVLDATFVGLAALGDNGYELIIGSDTTRTDAPSGVDYITAMNVAGSSPGAGCPVPGFDDAGCGKRTINVLDASAIAFEALGSDQPVVGDVIPLPKDSYVSGDIVDVLPGIYTDTVRWTKDKLYRLKGVIVIGVDTTGTDSATYVNGRGVLEIEEGTRIEGSDSSAIFITRNGKIYANGTATEPITFTCDAVTPAPQCWGGLFIAGNAVVNEQDAGLTATAPKIPGRNDTPGGNQREGEGGAVNFGGSNDNDSSGEIRYARFMYGGKDVTTDNELNNLTVGACGSGTILEHIQVHKGFDDGLEMFGGRCDVKWLYATANQDDQYDYSFGFDGRVQFVLIQRGQIVAGTTTDKSFEVDNTETAATYNNTPRVHPTVYNVTSIAGAVDAVSVHIHYRRGAGGTLRNMLLVGGAEAFRLDNTETCTDLDIDNVKVLSVTSLQTGSAGCATALGPNVTTGTYTNQLRAPFHTQLPDFRPAGNGIAGTTATPPNDGFFDTTATYFGAVPPETIFNNVIAWYEGWTVPWQSAITP